MNLLQRLLAMRHMLAPNPPDPAQGGGFVPDWSTGHPPSPARPMPKLPEPLPAIQAPPQPSSTPLKAVGDFQAPMAPVMGGDSGPMPTSASIPSMIQWPKASSLPPLKPTIPTSMGGSQTPSSVPSFQGPKLPKAPWQGPTDQPAPPMDTSGPVVGDGSPIEGLPGSELSPEQAPLDAAQMPQDLGAAVPGQAPQMAISIPGLDQQGGGDLVSLIKRLLHKR